MNKVIKFLIIVLLSGFSTLSFSQEMTQENFDKERTEIWADEERQMQSINEIFSTNPEKKDSLLVEVGKIESQTYQKMLNLSIKYLSLPGTLNFIYNIRNNVSKDSLQTVLDVLPLELKDSEYVTLIQKHIETNQVKEGDRFSDFEATDLNGDLFKLSTLQNKNILFLYGGLGCMGESGRNYLKNLYDSTSRETFEIVIYCAVESLDKLKEEKETFSTNYNLVSDFLLDHSPIKIKYGAQATPTCFFINKNGIIDIISIGLPVNQLNKLFEMKEL
ncbi:peroxiredoxin [Dysgonomonadaceae bacterium PH5-43]|nr:peroxiredoxin [Dysgonomonadaceae bacterium PH5-43]